MCAKVVWKMQLDLHKVGRGGVARIEEYRDSPTSRAHNHDLHHLKIE